MRRDAVIRAACCAAVLVFCTACADMPVLDDVSSVFSPPKPDPAAEMPALETRIFDLVQAARLKNDPKARKLTVDSELVDIARKRSAAMAGKNSFAVGSDPHAAATMLMDDDAKFQGMIGENVAAQHYNRAGIDVDVFAKRFVDSWLASKPHKENLLFSDYNRSGVGAAVNGDTIYVTQLFTTDLGLGPHDGSAPPSQVTRVASPQQGKDDSNAVPLRGAIAPGDQ
ncbi:MAG: CAP domain-containing protein [Alphaproteobacteria bacterium]|nr:CAP domain-containing protein [Alphaproteobacteria bacterium]